MKQRIAVSAKEVDKSKPLHVHTGAHSHPAASPSERTTQPITVIQEHIRFAESILASPTNSESGRRSRSFSPLPPHVALSPAHQTVRPAARSRSCSPLARSPGHSATTSSRKKLAFDGEKRSNSPLLSRSGRERKAHEIRTRLTNDFIDATSHGLHHPSHRITADRMAAVSSGHDPAAASKPTEIHSPQQFTDIYTTPETDRHGTAHRYGPMSSTPHKNRHEDPLRESSRLHNTRYHPDAQEREAPAVPNTPSTYIRGLQSVRSGLRKLMSDEVDAAQELMLDTSHRAENVSLRIESTINAENQLLRDQLTRERNLRKQIEADKHELQSQLLESKDRLHHLTSTLKQKDGMMKKLDQNLDDVVNGWQKYEQETKHMKNTLSHNICRLEAEVEEQKLYAATLATDLSNAVEELKRERETSRDFARDSHEQYTRCQEDLTDAKNSLASEEEKVLRLQVEVAQATESRLRVEKQLESLQSMLEQEREKFKEREEELLNKINDITSVQIAVLEQEAVSTTFSLLIVITVLALTATCIMPCYQQYCSSIPFTL
ncbi:CNTROB [Bugula neritina]|uniref:CNTROB n=1 Tax=Bugula neritina TaxID=10212 RepID=A0A7J7JKH1_BUGNE|nr:CNTROB [Bugula neritina]